MIKIEIFKEDERVEQRTSKPKDGNPGRVFYEQDGYVYLGGKFPSLMKVQLEEGQPPYAAGVYTVHSSSYVVNNFGSLELKRFGKLLVPLEAEL